MHSPLRLSGIRHGYRQQIFDAIVPGRAQHGKTIIYEQGSARVKINGILKPGPEVSILFRKANVMG